MQQHQKTIEQMTLLLKEHFQPTILEIEDQSHQHIGHPGAASGGGHFKLTIGSSAFMDKTKLQQHQLIYRCLTDLMVSKIHALSITVTP